MAQDFRTCWPFPCRVYHDTFAHKSGEDPCACPCHRIYTPTANRHEQLAGGWVKSDSTPSVDADYEPAERSAAVPFDHRYRVADGDPLAVHGAQCTACGLLPVDHDADEPAERPARSIASTIANWGPSGLAGSAYGDLAWYADALAYGLPPRTPDAREVDRARYSEARRRGGRAPWEVGR
jgi:hypothetical protein